MANRHALTRLQIPIVLDLLKEHCRKEGDRAVYAEGWDDRRIMQEAEKTNPEPEKPIGITSIINWRRDLYGNVRNFQPKPEPVVNNDLEDRLQRWSKNLHKHFEIAEERWFDRAVDAMNACISMEKERNDRRYTAWAEAVARRDTDVAARVEALETQWLHALEWLQRKGYQPPPGRPQSTPRDTTPTNGPA